MARFFAMKDVHGTVHSALDTCSKCYLKHLGFEQYGPGVMIENCFNMAFKIVNITAQGCSGMMCHPVYLANQIIGDQVVFAISDFQAGGYIFLD